MNFSPFAEPDAKKDLTCGIEAINLMKTILGNFYLFSDQKLLKRNQDYFGLILKVQRPLSEEKKKWLSYHRHHHLHHQSSYN